MKNLNKFERPFYIKAAVNINITGRAFDNKEKRPLDGTKKASLRNSPPILSTFEKIGSNIERPRCIRK